MKIVFEDSFWESLKRIDSFHHKFYMFFHDLKIGIFNFILWFKIIFQDRNWDHHYLYQILHYKLTLMKKYHEKYGITVDRMKYVKQIQFCINILDRLIEDNYMLKEYHEYLKDKSLDEILNDDHQDLVKKNIYFEEHRKKRDLKCLFSCINKYIRYWWD